MINMCVGVFHLVPDANFAKPKVNFSINFRSHITRFYGCKALV